MSGHTPGEWTIHKDRIAAPCFEHAGCEKTIAWRGWRESYTPGALTCTVGENEAANVRLFAAAPDLLAVAEEVLASATIETPRALLKMATEAIAKAEGK